jgi:hypothetical protein
MSNSYRVYILFETVVYKSPISNMTKIAVNINDDAMQKCIFIMNALENGWKVKKRKGSYIFTKRHENNKKILKDGYLELFLEENMKSFT